MTTRTRIIVGTAGVLLFACVVAGLFLRYQIRKSFPVTSGELTVAGLQHRVTVDRDAYGVPLIAAANERDLMFAVGFVHAQDRLWQMDLGRRAGEGRLSELFGEATVPFDRMFRIVGIRRTAEAIAAGMNPGSMNRLQAYADGVNAFISSARGRYPAEFDLLRYEPEPWTPLHSIIIGRMMAWELNLSWWTDVAYGIIAERVGLERALDIMPDYPRDVPPVVPPEEWRSYASLGEGYLRTAQQYAAAAGSASVAGGSNAWVVAPRRSASGAVMLANDTHLQLESPSRWYEIQMQMPGLRVRGMSLAGVPAVVAGRNDWIAWGLTNVMADDADFFVERLDSSTGTTSEYAGAWEPVRFLHEEISVRGDTALPLTIRLTRHGPIVTDIATPLTRVRAPYVASMRWTGHEIDDQFGAFTRINRATSWEEFIAGVREFAVPGQNFVYGDVNGNIGYWCGARIPLRGGRNSLLPLPGWDPGSDWRGFVPFSMLPHRFNPREGYIATANNKIVDDTYPYHLSDLWEPASRIQRLNAVLGRKDDLFSVADFERLQNDTYAQYACEIVPFIVGAWGDSLAGLPDGERVFEYFRNWNYQFTRDDIATTIFQEFMVRLIRNVFLDEMGEDAFHDWVMLTNIPMRVAEKLLREGVSPWFDDVSTPGIEDRDQIIRKSLREALQELQGRFGKEMKTWRWGELHTVTFRHPFGLRKPLDRIFNTGPFPVGGGSGALVSGEYSFNEPFAVTVGPSFRQIFDFTGEGGGAVRSILVPGQSGQVFHPHYADQTSAWLNGGYRITTFKAAQDASGDHLVLEPAR